MAYDIGMSSRRRVMAVDGLILDEVLDGGGRWRGFVGVAPVEVAVAATRGAF